MNCPRCPGSVLGERERDGITIDLCPTCRGVWLDRGELERLQARAIAEIEAASRGGVAGAAAEPASPLQGTHAASMRAERPWRDDEDDDDDDDDRRRRERHGSAGAGGPPRKRRWLDMFDLFD
jgi:Zn-finger nucleic acid-binding protein